MGESGVRYWSQDAWVPRTDAEHGTHTIQLGRDLNQALAEETRRLGVSQSELMRRALRSFLSDAEMGSRWSHTSRLLRLWAEADASGAHCAPKTDGWTREAAQER